MPKAKRPSVATIVSKSALEQAGVRLQELPDKPREVWSLRETVALLQTEITSALNRGYTYDEIVKVLADKGIDITVSSLKRYLATAKRDQKDTSVGSKTRQPRKTSSPKALAVKQTKHISATVSASNAAPTPSTASTATQPATTKSTRSPARRRTAH